MLPSQKILQQVFVARSDNPPQACFTWLILHVDAEPVATAVVLHHMNMYCMLLSLKSSSKYGK